jgi:hypothetical protein
VPRHCVPSLWRRSSSSISSRTWRVVLEDLALSPTSDRAATTRALPMAALSDSSRQANMLAASLSGLYRPRYSRLKLWRSLTIASTRLPGSGFAWLCDHRRCPRALCWLLPPLRAGRAPQQVPRRRQRQPQLRKLRPHAEIVVGGRSRREARASHQVGVILGFAVGRSPRISFRSTA